MDSHKSQARRGAFFSGCEMENEAALNYPTSYYRGDFAITADCLKILCLFSRLLGFPTFGEADTLLGKADGNGGVVWGEREDFNGE
jgi:hypothetical protein